MISLYDYNSNSIDHDQQLSKQFQGCKSNNEINVVEKLGSVDEAAQFASNNSLTDHDHDRQISLPPSLDNTSNITLGTQTNTNQSENNHNRSNLNSNSNTKPSTRINNSSNSSTMNSIENSTSIDDDNCTVASGITGRFAFGYTGRGIDSESVCDFGNSRSFSYGSSLINCNDNTSINCDLRGGRNRRENSNRTDINNAYGFGNVRGSDTFSIGYDRFSPYDENFDFNTGHGNFDTMSIISRFTNISKINSRINDQENTVGYTDHHHHVNNGEEYTNKNIDGTAHEYNCEMLDFGSRLARSGSSEKRLGLSQQSSNTNHRINTHQQLHTQPTREANSHLTQSKNNQQKHNDDSVHVGNSSAIVSNSSNVNDHDAFSSLWETVDE